MKIIQFSFKKNDLTLVKTKSLEGIFNFVEQKNKKVRKKQLIHKPKK